MEEVINNLYDYIINNYLNNINLDDLEKEYFYNKFYIVKAFKEYTGYTITELINMLKVYNSVDPLLYTDNTILKIALDSGYNSQEYYSEIFKNILGMSPIRFRKTFSNVELIQDQSEYNMKKDYLQLLYEYKENLYTRNKEYTRQRVA